jgi:UDP-GlcNAc:undecaprenyl-phosphate GlcNAc-1-phosphate transferase
MLRFLAPFLLSLGISLSLTPLIRQIALSYNLVARPKADRWHKSPTALLGGIAIFAAFLIPCLIYQGLSRPALGILIGAGILFFWGLYDDIFRVSPQLKLLGQIIAACIAVFSGVKFNFTPLSTFNSVITIFWIVAVTNAFNLIDNIDGLACGVAFIASFFLFLSSLLRSDPAISLLAVILSGAALGFLPYNFNPAKIFMGDAGSMFLGFILAAISILSSAQHATNLLATLAVPVLILAVPIFDTALVSFMRNVYGRSLFQGGKDHTSHRLVSLGLSERKTVLLLYLLSGLFGLIALAYSKIDILIVSILTVLALVVLLFFGIFLAEIKAYDNAERLEEEKKKRLRNGKTVFNSVILHKRRIFEVVVDTLLVCASYYSAYLLRFEGVISEPNFALINQTLPWIIVFRLASFYYFGLYRGIWHYIGVSDLVSIFKAVSFSSLMAVLFVAFIFRFKDFSRVVFLIDWLLLLFLVSAVRIFIRLLRETFIKMNMPQGKRILIMGAGDMGEAVLREIERSKASHYNPVGFVDDDLAKVGRNIHNIPVLGTREAIPRLIKEQDVQEIFIAILSFREEEAAAIAALCQGRGVAVRRIMGMLDFERNGHVNGHG